MKIVSSLGLIIPLLFAAGCSYEQRHAGYTGGSYGEVVSVPNETAADRALADAVRQQFNRYGELAPLQPNIQVHARDGRVTLTGTVPSQQQRKMIDAMVENTSGVVALNDQLAVWPGTAG